MSFFYSIGVATTAGFAYYIWNNFYPITMTRLVADSAWTFVRMKTRADMFYNKLEKFLYPWVATIVPEDERHDVKFYKDGLLITSMSYLNALKYEDDDFNEEYNKVTYEVHDDGGTNLVMIRDNVDDIMDKGLKKSNTRFISAFIKIPEQDDIEINLRERGDIYMVGNELFSKSFLQWWFYGKQIDANLLNGDYTISTIDDNVNMCTFKKNQYIVLKENGYDVVTLEQEEAITTVKNDESGFFSWFSAPKAKDD